MNKWRAPSLLSVIKLSLGMGRGTSAPNFIYVNMCSDGEIEYAETLLWKHNVLPSYPCTGAVPAVDLSIEVNRG